MVPDMGGAMVPDIGGVIVPDMGAGVIIVVDGFSDFVLSQPVSSSAPTSNATSIPPPIPATTSGFCMVAPFMPVLSMRRP